jgi:carbon-monoxide dehydrogenase small subunit
MKVRFTLNHEAVDCEGRPTDRLLDVLRETFHLEGTKEGCGEGECGACTVLLDDVPVLSCLTPLLQVDGRDVVTIEGLAADASAASFLERFVALGGTQCGACTPGMVLTGARLLAEGGPLDRDAIRRALAGNLCRCTGYESIVRSVLEEDAARRGGDRS